jgi:hypothetical protein
MIKKQYHENINSNIYAHFINSTESEVRNLFLNALLDLIALKSPKKIQIFDAYAQTEVKTSTGRLDILIEGNIDSGKILIENKIYHWLHNDLKEYWDFFICPADKKIGVLLTLEKHPIPQEVEGNFINVTHLEWINQVKANFIESNFSLNYQVYISDFIKTIESLSKSYKMNEAAKFYFQHTNQVLKARDTISEAHQFLNDQFEYVASEIGWQTYGSSMEWRNFWDEHNHLDTYLTITTKELLNGKMFFSLILELKRDDKNKLEDVKNILNGHRQYNPDIPQFSKGDYLHFQIKHYSISIEELANFGQIVVDKIREDFTEMTLMVIEGLYPEKMKNFTWREKFIGKN